MIDENGNYLTSRRKINSFVSRINPLSLKGDNNISPKNSLPSNSIINISNNKGQKEKEIACQRDLEKQIILKVKMKKEEAIKLKKEKEILNNKIINERQKIKEEYLREIENNKRKYKEFNVYVSNPCKQNLKLFQLKENSQNSIKKIDTNNPLQNNQ